MVGKIGWFSYVLFDALVRMSQCESGNQVSDRKKVVVNVLIIRWSGLRPHQSFGGKFEKR